MTNEVRTIKYDVKFRDLAIGNLTYNRQAEISMYVLALSVVVQLVLCLMNPAMTLYLAVVAPALLIALMPFIQAAGLLQQYPGYYKDITLTLTPDAVTNENQGSKQIIFWKDIEYVRYRAGNIFMGHDNNAWVIPRRAFHSRDEQRQFFNTAFDYWRAARVSRHADGNCGEPKGGEIHSYVGWAVSTIVGQACALAGVEFIWCEIIVISGGLWAYTRMGAEIAISQAHTAIRNHKYKDAAAHAKQALQKKPNNVQAQMFGVWTQYLIRDYENALALVDNSLETMSATQSLRAFFIMMKAAILAETDRLGEAMLIVNDVLAMNTQNGYAYTNRAYFNCRLGAPDLALKDLQEADKYDMTVEGRASRTRLWATVYLMLGQVENARKKIDEALKIQKDDPSVATINALVYWLEGDKEKAVKQLNHAISISPYSAEAFWARSQMRTASGDKERAMPDAARAMQLHYKPYLQCLFEAKDSVVLKTTESTIEHLPQ
jgi:tetratricopeptide (TPR) repeat protein